MSLSISVTPGLAACPGKAEHGQAECAAKGPRADAWAWAKTGRCFSSFATVFFHAAGSLFHIPISYFIFWLSCVFRVKDLRVVAWFLFFFGVCTDTLTNRGSSYCCLPSWAYTSGDFGVKLQLKTWLKEGADWSLVCCLGNFLFFPACYSVSTRLQSEPLSWALWLLGSPFIHWRWLFAELKAGGKSLLLHFFCVMTISLALKVVLWNLCTSFKTG